MKRFIASEYGVHPDTNFGRAEFFNAKREMRQLLDSSNFPDGKVFFPVSLSFPREIQFRDTQLTEHRVDCHRKRVL